MSDGTTIQYEVLVQEAMRGVVRNVLSTAATSGLPGDHHFYISFHTLFPGVSLSKRLKEKYPAEMTIVLQHRFWDLAVSEDRFEVKLTFDGIPERLVVPYAAIKVFFDPSVRYGLQFEDPTTGSEAGSELGPLVGFDGGSAGSETTAARSRSPRAAVPRKPRVVRKPRGEKASTPIESPPPVQLVPPTQLRPTVAPASGEGPIHEAASAAFKPAGQAVDVAASEATGDRPAPTGGAEIVRLDTFRKK